MMWFFLFSIFWPGITLKMGTSVDTLFSVHMEIKKKFRTINLSNILCMVIVKCEKGLPRQDFRQFFNERPKGTG